MSLYAAKNGREITPQEWSDLFADLGYRFVCRTQVSRELGWEITTIWQGIPSEGLFETRVEELVSKDNWHFQSATKTEALKAHGVAISLTEMGTLPQHLESLMAAFTADDGFRF